MNQEERRHDKTPAIIQLFSTRIVYD